MKFSIDPAEMVFVGDDPYDMSVEKNYGCFTVGRVGLIGAEIL